MAYRARGRSPSVKVGSRKSGGGSAVNYGTRRVYFIVYDFAYMAMEVILTFIVLLTILLTFIFGPKIKIDDPIGTLKSTIIWLQVLTIIVETFLVIKVAKNSNNGEERLRDMAFLLIGIMLIIIFVILLKIGLKNVYDTQKFTELYNKDIANGINNRVSKGFYINECVSDYKRFEMKILILLVGQVFTVLLNMYYLSRAIHYYSKEKKLEKDDIVVYDDEINIKN